MRTDTPSAARGCLDVDGQLVGRVDWHCC